MNETVQKCDVYKGEIVKLNIGGTHFSTMKSTLTKKIKDANNTDYEPHLLQLLVNGIVKITYDENHSIFIDRNPKYFEYILDYLRSFATTRPYIIPELSPSVMNEFYNEAEYYNMQGLLAIKGSTILSRKMFVELNVLCEFPKNQDWKLIYCASVDGFSSECFHSKCDGQSNTLTIIKSANGCIFGGYATTTWEQSVYLHYKNDANAFIFSLINISNEPVKLNCVCAGCAIYCSPHYGPSFGEIRIVSNSNLSSNNSAKFSNHLLQLYQLPPKCKNNSLTAAQFLAGSDNFQVKELEVYIRL